MKFLSSKVSLALLSIVVGGVLTFYTMNRPSEKQPFIQDALAQQGDPDPFQQMERMQEQMRKRMEQMLKQSAGSANLFNHQTFDDGLVIENKEDDQYKYLILDVTDIDKETLSIDIKNGSVAVSGQVRKSIKNQQGGMTSSSTFISTFSRQFPVPAGVDESAVKVEQKDKNIVISFPKEST